MKNRIRLAFLALTVGCGDKPEPEPPPLRTPTLADFAGAWDLTVIFPEEGDTVHATLSGSEAANNWVMVNPGNQRVRMPTVSLKGDSMILVSDRFPAVVNPGARAQVRIAAVLREGVMEGKILATFDLRDGSQQVRAGEIRAVRSQ
ncbi:MAG TPA: hypothetical protein PLL69_09355 [Gemmatimonadales bacterium]|nr:hypothetical protein [Gemmatimonadales bacterium]